MDNVSPKIAQYVALAQFEDLSANAVSSARRSTIDTLAAKELAPYGITSNAIAPGIVATPINRSIEAKNIIKQ